MRITLYDLWKIKISKRLLKAQVARQFPANKMERKPNRVKNYKLHNIKVLGKKRTS